MNLTKLYILDITANVPLQFTHFEDVKQTLIKDATSYMIDNWDEEDYNHIVEWSNTISLLNKVECVTDEFLAEYLNNMGYNLTIVSFIGANHVKEIYMI